MYQIEFSDTARRDLKWFKKHEQKIILDGIDANLKYEPNIQTRNRKHMQPNPVAEWELRIGKFRVLYNVEETVKIVSIEAIGIKISSDFVIRGEERSMRTVVVSPRSKTLRALLRKARHKGLILQSPEGEQFMLSPLDGWRSFYVGDSGDFAEEVKATSQNKELMKFLDKRTRKSKNSKRTPIEKVREELGLDSAVEQKTRFAMKEKKGAKK